MNYNRIAATANATRYIQQRDAEQRLEVERRISPSGNKMMSCGLTCQQWMDIYLKRNLPTTVVEHNTEKTNDDEDRGSITGTEARSGGAGEGVGDPPSELRKETAGSEASEERASGDAAFGGRPDDPGQGPNWIDEAYPEGSEGAEGPDFTSADRTPF